MNTGAATRDNPFATRFVRPGRIGYRFPRNRSALQLVEQLQALCWWGQIVGPHGSGKSTLLATLVPELERHGRRVVMVCLHGGPRAGRTIPLASNDWSATTQVIVDGYEQLGGLHRLRLRHAARRAGCGLLATTHRPVGLPDLARTDADLRTVLWIVRDLVGSEPVAISRDDIVASFAARQGNIREVLFDLYDLVERRRV